MMLMMMMIMMMMVMLMMVVMMISMMLMDDDDVDDDDDDYDDDLVAFQNDYYHARSKMTIITRSKTTPSRTGRSIFMKSLAILARTATVLFTRFD